MRLFYIFFALLITYSSTLACDYTVDLHDTFGDGWNGNSITITVNGTAVLTDITVATGSDDSYNFTANPGDVVIITYDNSGSWTSENEITITSDDLGAPVFTDGMGGIEPTGGSFTIGADCGLAPPANDEPCAALNLPMNGTCNPTTGSVNGSTTTAIPNPSCGTFTTQGDVWFETTVGASGLLQIDLTDGGIDANMAIYDGADCSNLNEIGCSVSNTYYSDIIPAGTQLWIRIWDENNSIGSFTICAIEPPPPPTNNDPCTAEDLTVNTSCINTTGTTESAINSAVANPTCSWGYSGGDVWYSAIVPASGFMHVNLTAGGLTDGGIAVYSGPDCNTLTEVACNESTWDMPAPVVITPANALEGQQVWIRIWEGDNNNPGSFDICLVDEPVLFVDPTTYTPEELITDILITGCLDASNVQYDGHPSAIAYFEGGEGAFGMASGVVLGSGSAVVLTGQGPEEVFGEETAQADVEADLSDISVLNGGASDMHDEVILEFDFVPSSDTTEFDFVFASVEYPGFEHTSYNDVFAFFVSGPGITGPYADGAINVALIPGTAIPITISTINGPVADGGSGDNSAYFAGYTGGSIPNFNVGGYTIPITAVMAGLTPCETYHIKFCIADASDGILSSYVFFEESSFSSGGDVSQSNFSNVGTDSDIYEGCENYYIFNRIDTSAVALLDTVEIILNIGGTATEGVDYTSIPDTMYILPGQTEYTLYYTAIFDDIDEGDEYVIFSLLNGCPCTMTSVDDTIWIKNNYHLNATITDPQLICFGDSALIQAEINPNIDPLLVTYLWDSGDTTDSYMSHPNNTTTYSITITNICENDAILNSTVQVVPTIDPNFSLSKDTACVGEPIVINFIGSATGLAQYDWTFQDGEPNSISGAGPHNVTWATTGIKNINLHINDQGCFNDTTLQIYIKEYNNMNLITSASDINCFSICDGTGSVTANTGVAPFSYLWEDGRTTQSINQLCPGNFNVTVSDAYGCMDTTHINVTAPTLLTYTYSTTPTTCNGYDDGSATITASGGTPPYEYLWSNDITVENNINLFADTYAVTITDANGCQEIESNIPVIQPSAVNTSIYGTHIHNGGLWICIGETETLSTSATGGVGPYTFIWNAGITADQISVSPLTTTSYSAYAIDNNGCLSPEKEITVNVYEPISINVSATPYEICKGEIVEVNIDAEGGNGEYIYTSENSSGVTTVSSNYTISPEQSQDYVITVSDNCNSPFDRDTFGIIVNNAPIVSFHASKMSGCPPLEINFIESSPDNNQSYYWEFTNSSESIISFDKNPSQIFNIEGAYDVKLTVTSEKDCSSELTKYNYITVFPTPEARFKTKPSVASIIKPIIYFQNNSLGTDYNLWSFGDSDSSHTASPDHIYPNRVSEYYTTLVTLNRFGCSDTVSQKVRIIDEITFYAPTAFSPDGDGKNEAFMIKGNGIISDGFEMIVYDRWGMEVFRTNNINEAWNGKLSNNYVKAGVYSWIVKFTDIYKVPHEKSGSINVIR